MNNNSVNPFECSPFFMASSLLSYIVGEQNSDNTLKNNSANIDFKQLQIKAKEAFEDAKFATEFLLKKKNIAIGQQYQLKESKIVFETQRKTVEFRYYCNNCWPLNLDIATVWNLQNLEQNIVPISVIVGKSNTAGNKFNSDYANINQNLKNQVTNLGNVNFLPQAWGDADYSGGIAQSMNIHYIMQGLPTLIIMPYYLNGRLYFNVSTWSFHRGIGSLNHGTALSIPYNDSNYIEQKNLINKALFIISGVIRDAYIAMEYRKPAALPEIIKEEINSYPQELIDFISTQYHSMEKQIEMPCYRAICDNDGEYDNIRTSLIPIFNLLDR